MLLSKRLPEAVLLGRQPQQFRSNLAAAPSTPQQRIAQSQRFDRTIACVQPQQHEQHLQTEVVQQERASTSACTAPLPIGQAAKTSRAVAAVYVLSKLQRKWQQLASWCKQHRVQQLLWG